jgi:DNA topoisomerase-1
MTIVERLQLHGIRRLGTMKSGFRYRNGTGRILAAPEVERVRALRIPPAWTDVAIHPTGRASVVAVGKDAAGRWQYLYHPAHVARREREKQERMIRFIQALPAMRRRVARDLARPGFEREKVLAAILKILTMCFLRPGSEDYANENGSYGIATLRRKHVTVKGDVIRFDFVGKAKVRHQREVRDRRLARLVRDLVRYPGDVFKFVNGDGRMTDVRRKHINAYIKEVMGGAFSAKDFRTWAANLLFASALARLAPRCEPRPRARQRQVAAVFREVAGHLGNTPAVCRNSYVFEVLIHNWEKGRILGQHLSTVEALGSGSRAVERSERALLAMLQRAA